MCIATNDYEKRYFSPDVIMVFVIFCMSFYVTVCFFKIYKLDIILCNYGLKRVKSNFDNCYYYV